MCRQLRGMPRSPISQVTWCADSGDRVQKSHCMSWSRRLLFARRFWERMKCWNFIGSRHEEHRGVVPDHVVVAVGGVELQREATRVTPGVGAAPLSRDGGEPDECLGAGAGLEY